jgi:N-acetylmuramoyl-L-alanine amidase
MRKRTCSFSLAMLLGLAVATASGALLSAPAMYADALAKEQAVREAISTGQPAAAVLKAVRTVVNGYEALVRHYPTSGYCDDALWNAAQLSIEAAKQLHDSSQSAVAIRLLKQLASEYPSSKWAKQTPNALAALGAAPESPIESAATPRNAAGSREVAAPRETLSTAAAPTPPDTTAPREIATLTGITRIVLPDVVRVTIALDVEVPYRQEELSGPPRLFFDLAGTRAAQHLADRTLRFDSDADILRQIRIGRQPENTLRVVLETAGAQSCSVSPLYTPYRLVVDCVRSAVKSTVVIGPQTAVSRPVPRSPATLARKLPAVPAMATDAPPKAVGTAGATFTPPPAIALAARSTVSAMFVPGPLFARLAGFGLVAWALPAGKPSISAASLAVIAAEPIPDVTTLSPTQTQALLPAPVAPVRNLAGGFSMARQLGLSVSRIVIDPGHGGHDPGAKGSGITEASLVLDIALRLEALLQKQQGVEVILTRRADEFVALEERTAIANRHNADLFLSIHANASAVAQAAGVETYFLNFATSNNAAAVAARENAASGQPMSALPDFVRAIALNNKVDESRDFATQVQRSLVQSLKVPNQTVRDLGVKQAPFVVLVGASMPSALAEVSFVTNEREARLLKGPNYRQRIAEALLAAVQKYQASLSRTTRATQQ